MTRVLVTDGAGFVGSHVVDEYVDAGYDVTVVDNLLEQVHETEPEYLNDDVEYVWGDIRDRELMTDLLTDVDVLNHQASAVGVGQSMYEIEKYVDVNTMGTARILDNVVEEEVDLKKWLSPPQCRFTARVNTAARTVKRPGTRRYVRTARWQTASGSIYVKNVTASLNPGQRRNPNHETVRVSTLS